MREHEFAAVEEVLGQSRAGVEPGVGVEHRDDGGIALLLVIGVAQAEVHVEPVGECPVDLAVGRVHVALLVHDRGRHHGKRRRADRVVARGGREVIVLVRIEHAADPLHLAFTVRGEPQLLREGLVVALLLGLELDVGQSAGLVAEMLLDIVVAREARQRDGAEVVFEPQQARHRVPPTRCCWPRRGHSRQPSSEGLNNTPVLLRA